MIANCSVLCLGSSNSETKAQFSIYLLRVISNHCRGNDDSWSRMKVVMLMVIIVAWYTTNLLFSIQQICFIIVVDEVKEETITTIIIIWEAAIEFGHRFEVFL